MLASDEINEQLLHLIRLKFDRKLNFAFSFPISLSKALHESKNSKYLALKQKIKIKTRDMKHYYLNTFSQRRLHRI